MLLNMYILHTGDDGCVVSFNAHKALLCRYSYFSALLSGKFSEARHPSGESTTADSTTFTDSTTTDSRAVVTVDLSGFVQDGLSDPRLFGVLLRQVHSVELLPLNSFTSVTLCTTLLRDDVSERRQSVG